MNGLTTIFCSLVAGLHASCYGAYKDSPHESFLLKRFVRELIIALCIGVSFWLFDVGGAESCFIIYLSTFTISRLITEFWKLNIRSEPQEQFRIPTQIHFFKKIVHNRGLRFLLGFVTPAVVLGVYLISRNLPDALNLQQKGIVVGLLIGLADASGGAYKDGMIEGFYLRKFLKSSLFGPLGGFVISYYTEDPLFHLLGTIGFMRMFLELLYKILVKAYVPGKFKSMVAQYPEWSIKRKWFLVPYTLTWTIFVIFLFV
ncbi:hypothetical protein JW824_11545 [bacterium]|nr:hypothetical protein [bacterium]